MRAHPALAALLLAPAAALAQPTLIAIHHFAFTPADLTITVNDTVRWENHDDSEHTVTSQTGPGTLIPSGVFDSGLLLPQDSFEFTFTQPGIYHYFCQTHGSSMQAVLRVTPCPADFDWDGFITGLDFDAFTAAFEAGHPSADFDSDGFITDLDFDAFVAAFEAGC